MRSALPLRVLIVTLLSGLLASAGLPALAQSPVARQAQACPNELLPPPPVDTSEKPPPGQPSPVPLPVPDEPAGGERMAECGYVVPPTAPAPPEPDTAASWLLQDMETGEVLAAKDPHGRQRPASLIKTLLALVVIDELSPEHVVIPTVEDANQECTCVGIVAGSRYTVDDLLHALLMRSGNDVAHALGTALGGVPTAVGKMNALAKRLGAEDTRAATPSGLDGPGMMTSAYDMSLIFGYAMRQPEYADAVGTQHMDFPGGTGQPSYPIYNDNQLWDGYEGFLGGKTGFTDDSRHTYAGAAERDGTRISVIMLRTEQRPVRVAEQAKALLDYGFALAASGADPVGQVTIPDPAEVDEAAAGESDSGDVSAASSSVTDPFGTTGWIVTLIVIVIVAIGLLIGHRKGLLQRPE
ncbi:peptidase M15 [Prauserella sp. PE36]|uniref:D-alanyl-D-alanine carboxypeptidase family protein n=1 Tax=Prauserella sp. PE36 TaxID=1504709 RepID=UPI000DE53846|nr:D-alanyl-D-alanine carboxypeptidase family protein [Prauserella sp. PE36]RBM11397.1 peptidase M15 [Prauserella sp. PE36]